MIVKKRIMDMSGRTGSVQTVIVDGIYAIIKWTGSVANVANCSIDGIQLTSLSDGANGAAQGGSLEFPCIRNYQGEPVSYNDKIDIFVQTGVFMSVTQFYVDPVRKSDNELSL